MRMRRWSLVLAVCLLVLAVLAGIKFQQIRAAIALGESFPEASATVEALTLEQSVAASHVDTIGEIVAPEALELRNELEGRVVTVNFASGGRVRKGEVLLALDTSEERARLEAATAGAALAEMNLQRQRKLLANRSVSQDRVDQARAEADIAHANVRQLQAIIDKKTLRAPFDALAGIHDIEAGEYLAANTALVTLQGLGDFLWVDFGLPLAQASMDIGARVALRSVGTAGEGVHATVVARNPAVSPHSRSLRYRARLEALPGMVPGSVVNVRVTTGERHLVRVPAPALLRDDMGSYVFVLEADADGYRARRRPVEVDSEDADTAAVRKGLAAGETIATHGAFKLRDGMRAVVGERPVGAAAAAE